MNIHRPCTPQRAIYPHLGETPSSDAELDAVLGKMIGADTDAEDPCVETFKLTGVMPDPAVQADEAQEVLDWCVRRRLVEPFLLAARSYGADRHQDVNRFRGSGVELEFERGLVDPEDLDFFIEVLPRCPQITGIALPLPTTAGQADRLADALARRQGLAWLELFVPGDAAPDVDALLRLFSPPSAAANALSELRLHMPPDMPEADRWMPALCTALESHLSASSVQLTLPWSADRLRQLCSVVAAHPGVASSLSLSGMVSDQLAALLSRMPHPTPIPGRAFRRWERPRSLVESKPMWLSLPRLQISDGIALARMLDTALRDEGCLLKSLSFPRTTLDNTLVDAVISAVAQNRSLTELDLGDTPLTVNQRAAVDAALTRNRDNALRALGWHGRV